MWKRTLYIGSCLLMGGCELGSCADTAADCDSRIKGAVAWGAAPDETFAVTWLDACTLVAGVTRAEGSGYFLGIKEQGDTPYLDEACDSETGALCHTIPDTGQLTLSSVNDSACDGAGKDAVTKDATTFVHRDMSLIFSIYDEEGKELAQTCGGCDDATAD
jgi:hypothetical protein